MTLFLTNSALTLAPSFLPSPRKPARSESLIQRGKHASSSAAHQQVCRVPGRSKFAVVVSACDENARSEFSASALGASLACVVSVGVLAPPLALSVDVDATLAAVEEVVEGSALPSPSPVVVQAEPAPPLAVVPAETSLAPVPAETAPAPVTKNPKLEAFKAQQAEKTRKREEFLEKERALRGEAAAAKRAAQVDRDPALNARKQQRLKASAEKKAQRQADLDAQVSKISTRQQGEKATLVERGQIRETSSIDKEKIALKRAELNKAGEELEGKKAAKLAEKRAAREAALAAKKAAKAEPKRAPNVKANVAQAEKQEEEGFSPFSLFGKKVSETPAPKASSDQDIGFSFRDLF